MFKTFKFKRWLIKHMKSSIIENNIYVLKKNFKSLKNYDVVLFFISEKKNN